MKLKEGLTLVELGDQVVAVPTGEAAAVFQGVIRLNDTGHEVWQGLADGLDEAAIAERLTSAYEVDEPTALAGVRAMVDQLRAAGLLED